jgi:hypothetical protein
VSSANYQPGPSREPTRPAVDAGTLWAGGLATAAVAALAYTVGVVIARGVLDVAVLAPSSAGVFGDASTWYFAAGAFVAALLATGLLHVLLLGTPRPFSFFAWIVGLVTTLVTVLPFTQDAELSAKLTTAAINLVVGVVIGTLLRGVGGRALRGSRRPGGASGTGHPTDPTAASPPWATE